MNINFNATGITFPHQDISVWGWVRTERGFLRSILRMKITRTYDYGCSKQGDDK